MDIWSYFCYVVAFAVYLNTLTAEFVYDDRRAILTNQDVNSNNAFNDLWKNDFWGTPIASSNSHGSYRPICVLTFRLNHWLFNYRPWGYHLTNVILHVITTGLVLRLARHLLPSKAAIVGSLLFAVHPIHTEAVAGIVGRADVIACIFYLLAILSYIQHCEQQLFQTINAHTIKEKSKRYSSVKLSSQTKNDHQRKIDSAIDSDKSKCYVKFAFSNYFFVFEILSKYDFNLMLHSANIVKSNIFLLFTVLFAYLATFSKEIGFTVLPVCLLFEFLFWNRLQTMKHRKKSRWKNIEILLISAITLLLVRINVSGFYIPTFSTADNPIAKSDILTRFLTFLYLPVLNFKLLLFPNILSFDWGMDSISKVSTIFDIRNFLTVLFYSILYVSIKIIYKQYDEYTRLYQSFLLFPNKLLKHNEKYSSPFALLFLIILSIISFLPSTNLFFYVGFVVAERVLYIPSVGICLLIAYGYHVITLRSKSKWSNFLFVPLIFIFAIRSILRNSDWQNEEKLYKSSIMINPPKAYGNLGSVLSDQGRLKEAEVAFRTALKYRYNMADVHYNLGLLLEKTNRSNEAINSYKSAIQYRSSLAVAYVKLGQLLMTKNLEEEAKQIFLKCSQLDGTGLRDLKLHEIAKIEALINLASIKLKNSYHEEALSIYIQAIISAPSYYQPQVLYNLVGKTLIKMEKYEEAEKWFRYVTGEAAFEKQTFQNLNSFFNSSQSDKTKWLKILKKNLKFDDPFINLQYGQLLFNMKKYQKAAEIYKKVIKLLPEDYELMKKTAKVCKIAGLLRDAEEYYQKVIHLKRIHPV